MLTDLYYDLMHSYLVVLVVFADGCLNAYTPSTVLIISEVLTCNCRTLEVNLRRNFVWMGKMGSKIPNNGIVTCTSFHEVVYLIVR